MREVTKGKDGRQEGRAEAIGCGRPGSNSISMVSTQALFFAYSMSCL